MYCSPVLLRCRARARAPCGHFGFCARARASSIFPTHAASARASRIRSVMSREAALEIQSEREAFENRAMAKREADRNFAAQLKDEVQLSARLSFEAEMRRVQREADASIKSALTESALNLKLAEAADEAAQRHKRRADNAEAQVIELEQMLIQEQRNTQDAIAQEQEQSAALSEAAKQLAQLNQRSIEAAPDTVVRKLREEIASKDHELQQAQAHLDRLEEEFANLLCTNSTALASTDLEPPFPVRVEPFPEHAIDGCGPSFTRWIHELQINLDRANRRAVVAESLNKELQAKVEKLANGSMAVGAVCSPYGHTRLTSQDRKMAPASKSFHEQLEQLVCEREALRKQKAQDPS